MADEREYILGTGTDELSRLGIQHRVWADAAVGAWKKAAVLPGSHVLDLGCGPGHATFDIAQMVTETGRVLGVDASPRFLGYLNSQAKSRGLPHVSAQEGDAENLLATLPKASFDVVYCRWVLCWLKHPEKALAGIRDVLKPGGRAVIHDYFNWQAMTSAPRSEAISKMVMAAVASFRDGGGDIDISSRLPKLIRESGMTLDNFEVHQRVARGGGRDGMLAWILTWWRTYGPKLVEMGKLSQADYSLAASDLKKLEADEDLFFFCPPLFEFIVRR